MTGEEMVGPNDRLSGHEFEQTPGIPHCGWILYHMSHQGSESRSPARLSG